MDQQYLLKGNDCPVILIPRDAPEKLQHKEKGARIKGFPCLLSCILLFLWISAGAQNIKAGTGKKSITPPLPFLLTGYAGRTQPAADKVHDLWAKALVIESSPKERAVIVSIDILGLTPEITQDIVTTLHSKYGFQRSQILLNASHTHAGPFIWPALGMIGDYDSGTVKSFYEYNRLLTGYIIEAVDLAVKDLAPAILSSGHGAARFAKNRRQHTPGGVINGINPTGSTDHDVPVLRAVDKNGTVKAILFGYACHNTTLGGNNNLISGDYAGFAQIELEKMYPGANALFFTGCGGDQNPQPRGTLALAEQHGKELATAVKTVLSGEMKPVHGTVKSAQEFADLRFTPYNIHQYREDLKGTNAYKQRRAKLMVEALNRGWNIADYKYPVQAIRIGKDLTILSLAGEVVVDYALQAKKKYAKENLFVAGYCDHVTCYIPTGKVLEEGGYEADDNLIYYGQPGPFEKNVEAKIFAAIAKVFKQVGIR